MRKINMGYSIARTIDIISIMIQRDKDLYSMARSYGMSSDGLRNKRKEHILEDPRYQKLPHWGKARIEGYRECLHDSLYRYDLIFSYDVQGERLAINTQEYTEKVDYNTLDANTGRHIWIKSGNIFS